MAALTGCTMSLLLQTLDVMMSPVQSPVEFEKGHAGVAMALNAVIIPKSDHKEEETDRAEPTFLYFFPQFVKRRSWPMYFKHKSLSLLYILYFYIFFTYLYTSVPVITMASPFWGTSSNLVETCSWHQG